MQTQYGRMTVDGDRLIDAVRTETRTLTQILASIEQLVAFQARAARGGAEADAAYVAAIRTSDVELQTWALWDAKERIDVPSRALADAVVACWCAAGAADVISATSSAKAPGVAGTSNESRDLRSSLAW